MGTSPDTQPLSENAVVPGHVGSSRHRDVERWRDVDGRITFVRVTNSMCADRAMERDGIGLKNVRERHGRPIRRIVARSSPAIMASEWVSDNQMPAIRESPPICARSGRRPIAIQRHPSGTCWMSSSWDDEAAGPPHSCANFRRGGIEILRVVGNSARRGRTSTASTNARPQLVFPDIQMDP